MSSTNKTEHLQLNQWVLSDQFCMEDFNADNQKVDAALGAVPLVKLMDVTIEEAVNQVDLDLSAFDLEQFGELIVYQRCDALTSIYMRVNGIGTYSYNAGYGGSGSETYANDSSGSLRVQLGRANCYVVSSTRIYTLYVTTPASALTTLNLLRSTDTQYLYPVGTRFVVMGVRL